jgi:hypothetical protein
MMMKRKVSKEWKEIKLNKEKKRREKKRKKKK